MSSKEFIERQMFDDLEIKTSDDMTLYTSKAWLYNVSDYFKELLTKNFKEGNGNQIKLNYPFVELVLVLKCVKAIGSSNEQRNECLLQIDNIKNVNVFLEMCNEFKLSVIGNMLDQYFVNGDKLRHMFSLQFLRTVNALGLTETKLKMNELLRTNSALYFGVLGITNMKIDELYTLTSILSRWGTKYEILKLWLGSHDPTDEEIEKYNIFGDYENYKNIEPWYILHLPLILKTLKNAPKAKCKIYEKMLENNDLCHYLQYGQ